MCCTKMDANIGPDLAVRHGIPAIQIIIGIGDGDRRLRAGRGVGCRLLEPVAVVVSHVDAAVVFGGLGRIGAQIEGRIDVLSGVTICMLVHSGNKPRSSSLYKVVVSD